MNAEELRLYTLLQPEIREAMGPLQHGDWYQTGEGTIYLYFAKFNGAKPYVSEGCIRLPLPIDPRNPERGLWGICKGVVTVGRQLFIPDSYFVSVRITDENGNYKKFISFKGATPTLALLKALAHQWGKE